MPQLRGIQVLPGTDGASPLRRASQSVIGIIGTAENAVDNTFPLNTPYLVKGPNEVRELNGTLGRALRHIFAQSRARIIAIRVEDNSDMNAVRASIYNAIPNFDMAQSSAGVRPRIYLAPGYTEDRPMGVSAVSVTTAGTGYTAAPQVTIAAPSSGIAAEARATIDSSGTVTAITVTYPGIGYTGGGAVPVVTVADPTSGTTATASSSLSSSPNPIIARLLSRVNAEGKGGIVISDVGPANATRDEAATFKNDYADRRLYLVYPWVKTPDSNAVSINVQSSPFVAGLIAKNDAEFGINAAPTGQALNLATGLSVELPFEPNDPLSTLNFLGERSINAIVNRSGRRQIWGPFSTDPSTSVWRYIMWVRQFDQIRDALNTSLIQFIDTPLTPDTIDGIITLAEVYLSAEQAIGAINNYTIEADEERNTPTSLRSGTLYLTITFDPFAPTERIIVRLSISSPT